MGTTTTSNNPIRNEIKNNLQGINSGECEAKNLISDLERKEAKDIQSVQQEEKWIQKIEYNVRIVYGTISSVPTFASQGCQEKRARNWKPIWENNKRKFPELRPSRLERFTGFGQTEEYSRSHWDVWHAFIQEWAIHACCKLRVPECVTACHLVGSPYSLKY